MTGDCGGRTQTNYFRYPNGSMAHLHYPGGHYIWHDYTSRGQLAATGWDDEENNWWKKLAAYTYLPDGKVDFVDYGNATTSDSGYDDRGYASSMQHKRTASGEVIASHSYTRDTRDRITSLRKGYNPGSNPLENGRGDRYRYDEEGQLAEAWYNASDPASSGAGNTRYDGFAYDALGNRTQNNFVASRGLTSFVRRDNGLNQYGSWTPSIIYHDDNYPGWGPAGNGVTMAEGWITASYNALNQPVAIWSPAYNSTSDFMWFGFDPLGRCVKRWVGPFGGVYSNPATYLHYDGWNLLQEGTNAWGPSRVYAHGNRVDEIVWSYNTFTGQQAFHHYDARGHCTFLTGSTANILEQYEYDAFGHPYFFNSASQPINFSTVGNRFLFTGREWLSDLRLYDFRNRMYQPELGRFLQPDPKHLAAGDYNLYRYCHNDPINKTDPMGLAATGVIGKIVEFIRGVKDTEKTVAEVRTMKDAVKALKEGEDVRFKSEKLAREGAKQAGGGKTPVKETDRFGRHYHDAERRGGHALFGSAGVATIRDALPPNASAFERASASVLDFLNPILIINDVIEIGKSVPITHVPNSTTKVEIDYAP